MNTRSNLQKETQLGIGWRPELAVAIDRRTDIEFVEVLFENVKGGVVPDPVLRLRQRGVEVIPHGISMSFGGAERPNLELVKRFNDLAEQLDSPFVSEHISFVSADGKNSGHLLPVPRTKKALAVIVENIVITKEHLTVPLALENIAMLCDWQNSEMDEAEFVTQVLLQTNSLLLLDVANLYANSVNHNFDPVAFMKKLPLDRIAYVHTAGGTINQGIYHDTHAHPVVDDVLDLLNHLDKLAKPPRVMLERDDNFPDATALNQELDCISEIITSATKEQNTNALRWSH